MVKSTQAAEAVRADDLVARLRELDVETAAILREARTGKLARTTRDGDTVEVHDPDIAIRALARIEKQIELRAELLGELNRNPQINITTAPQWVQLQALILTTLDPFPEAKAALAAAMVGVAHA
jgi:hypothetical protein